MKTRLLFFLRTKPIGHRIRIRFFFEFSKKYHPKHRWLKFCLLLHTDGTCNSCIVVSRELSIKMVIRTASMRSAIMLDVERSRRRCLNFKEFSRAFEKTPPRFKVFQQRIHERRPKYMESTWGRILTNPRLYHVLLVILVLGMIKLLLNLMNLLLKSMKVICIKMKSMKYILTLMEYWVVA